METVDDSVLSTDGPALRAFVELLAKDSVLSAIEPPDPSVTEVDYLAFFRKDKKRARAAKLRSMGSNPREE